jgi:hypothetical protein
MQFLFLEVPKLVFQRLHIACLNLMIGFCLPPDILQRIKYSPLPSPPRPGDGNVTGHCFGLVPIPARITDYAF